MFLNELYAVKYKSSILTFKLGVNFLGHRKCLINIKSTFNVNLTFFYVPESLLKA